MVSTSHCFAIAVSFCHFISITLGVSCLEAESCAGDHITATGTTRALIKGYKAAFGSITSFTGYEVNCAASFACYEMSYINASSVIDCKGRSSCSHTTMRCKNEAGPNIPYVRCRASDSCSFSNISTDTLYCNAYLSCSNTNIQSTPHIFATGQLSLYQSIIDTQGSTTYQIHLYLHGARSGYGAKLICREGHHCFISCTAYDACDNFKVDCIGNCTIDTVNNDTSPPFYSIPPLINDAVTIVPDLLQLTVPIHDDTLCNQWNSDDSQENRLATVTLDAFTAGPLCCRGWKSCLTFEVLSGAAHSSNIDIVCDGHESCRYSNLIADLPDATVYCSGMESCKDSIITDKKRVFCTGYHSCRGTTMQNIQNITCNGHGSCANVTFISGGSNLNVNYLGFGAGRFVKIHCNDTDVCNVYCDGLESCEKMKLFCENNCDLNCSAAQCPEEIQPSFNPTQSPIVTVTSDPTQPPFNLATITTLDPSQSPFDSSIVTTQNPTELPLITTTTFHPTSFPIDITIDPTLQTSFPSANNHIKTSLYTTEASETNMKSTLDTKVTQNDVKSTEPPPNLISKPTSFSFAAIVISCVSVMFIFVIVVIFGTILYRKQKRKIQEQIENMRQETQKAIMHQQGQLNRHQPQQPRAALTAVNYQNTLHSPNIVAEDGRNRVSLEGCVRVNDSNAVRNMDDSDEIIIGDDEATDAGIAATGEDVVYNMNADGDEIVIGDDEVETAGGTNMQNRGGQNIVHNVNVYGDKIVVGADEVITSEGGSDIQTCVDCGEAKKGKIHDGDGLFYCDKCWSYYAYEPAKQTIY